MPGDDECTTAKPRGTQVCTSEFAIIPRGVRKGIGGISPRTGGVAPSACEGFQKYAASVPPVPAK